MTSVLSPTADVNYTITALPLLTKHVGPVKLRISLYDDVMVLGGVVRAHVFPKPKTYKLQCEHVINQLHLFFGGILNKTKNLQLSFATLNRKTGCFWKIIHTILNRLVAAAGKLAVSS